MDRKKIDLTCISSSRLFLLGIATLLVVFFHSDYLVIENVVKVNFLTNILKFIQKTGNFGVDLFLLLSGIGLYFSLSKNNIKTFYKNRFIRILPVFIIVTVVYAIITKTMTVVEVLETLFFISFFVKGNADVWFMPFIMVMYLLFPLLYKIIYQKDWHGLVLLLFITMLFNLLYSIFFPTSYVYIEIALTRISVFILGVYLGKLIYLKQSVPWYMFLFSILLQIFMIYILYMNINIERFSIFSRYLYCILAVCSVINISFLMSLLKNKNILLIKIIEFLGLYSLEIYLIFEKVEYVLMKEFNGYSIVLLYILCFFVTLLLSIAIKEFVNMLILLFNKIILLIKKGEIKQI